MKASSSGTWAASGQKNGLSSTTDQSHARGVIVCSWLTQARTVTPKRSRSHFLAMTPAATRIVVSRAELRPPPRGSRMPYFCQ